MEMTDSEGALNKARENVKTDSMPYFHRAWQRLKKLALKREKRAADVAAKKSSCKTSLAAKEDGTACSIPPQTSMQITRRNADNVLKWGVARFFAPLTSAVFSLLRPSLLHLAMTAD